jgi:hypothetical protein
MGIWAQPFTVLLDDFQPSEMRKVAQSIDPASNREPSNPPVLGAINELLGLYNFIVLRMKITRV